MSDRRNLNQGNGAPRLWYAGALALLLALPWLPVNSYAVHIAQTFTYTAIAVIGLSILLGLSGQMSLGQAGFYALGAYGSALMALKLGWPIALAVLVGTLVAAAAGALVGVFALRTRGLYLAMTTLAIGFVIDILAQRWVGLTGGTMGLMSVPQISLGDGKRDAMWFLYFAGACFLFVQIGADYVNDSSLGRRLRAIRDSETFAAAVGVRVPWWRATTFAACAALAGLGGALFAHQSGFVGSDAFSVRLSISLLIAAVVGGLGARSGATLGTLILLWIVEFIAGVEKYGLMIFGWTLLVVLLAFPQGLAGLFGAIRKRFGAAAPVSEKSSRRCHETTAMAALNGCALSIDTVTKRYAGVLAVDGVSLEVRKGTVHGLIGPNGAGKSTLINVVAGLYRCDSGGVRIDGHDISALETADRARLGLARTFQNLQLIDAMTSLDNVQLGIPRQLGIARDFLSWWQGTDFESAERSKALAIMSFLGIAQLADRTPGELSYGHRKLLELARAIAQQPRLMLLDEPIAGLNAQEAKEIAAVVRRLRDLGVTIILVEHNMEFVMSICDAVSVLDHGQLIASGTPAEVQRDPRVVSAYLGSEAA